MASASKCGSWSATHNGSENCFEAEIANEAAASIWFSNCKKVSHLRYTMWHGIELLIHINHTFSGLNDYGTNRSGSDRESPVTDSLHTQCHVKISSFLGNMHRTDFNVLMCHW